MTGERRQAVNPGGSSLQLRKSSYADDMRSLNACYRTPAQCQARRVAVTARNPVTLRLRGDSAKKSGSYFLLAANLILVLIVREAVSRAFDGLAVPMP